MTKDVGFYKIDKGVEDAKESWIKMGNSTTTCGPLNKHHPMERN